MLLASSGQSLAYYNETLSKTGDGSYRATEIEVLPPASETPASTAGNVVERPLTNAAAQQINSATQPPPNVTGRVVTGAAPTAPPQTSLNAGVSQTGKKQQAKTITSKGKNVALRIAVTLVIPNGWTTTVADDVAQKKVSWNATNKAWTSVLDGIARQAGAHTKVNWTKASVSIAKASAPATTAAGGTTATTANGGIVKKAILSKGMTGRDAARHYNIPEETFYRWNHFGNSTWLAAGYEVYITEPPAGTIVVANIPAGPDNRNFPEQPIPKNVQPAPAGTPATIIPAAVPVAQPVVRPVVQPVAQPLPLPLPQADPYPAQTETLAAPAQVWAINQGSLSNQLMGWASSAGYQLVWKVNRDLEMTSYSQFPGSFHEAIKNLFNGLALAGHPLRVTLYEGNRVVEVVEE
jgi:hypothetical protein